jgi:integrase
MAKLSARKVATLKKPGRYGDGHGLYLQITPADVRSWLLRYQVAGRERFYGLGPLHTVTLAEARERARRARLLILDGIDPIDARKAERAERALAAAKKMTFEVAALAYFNQHSPKWGNAKHRQQYLHTMRDFAFPHIGRLSVADIDTGLVLKCVEPIWASKTETASRVRGRIESVLDWCSVRGYRSGDNPARWKSHLAHLLPARSQLQKTVHLRAMPFDDLPTFMAELKERKGVAAQALEFTILTAARTGETIGAKRAEIDLDKRVWTIPAERMKARKEHRVPLSDRAVQILKALPRELPAFMSAFDAVDGSSTGTAMFQITPAIRIPRMSESGT